VASFRLVSTIRLTLDLWMYNDASVNFNQSWWWAVVRMYKKTRARRHPKSTN